MNQTKKNNARGQLIFAFLIVSILATIYTAQAGMIILLYVCGITGLFLSLGLLILMLQVNKEHEETLQMLDRMKQRESTHLKEKRRLVDVSVMQQTEEFCADDLFSRIMAATGSHFDNAPAYAEKLLQSIAKELEIVQGLVFVLDDKDHLFHISGEYAYYSEERPRSFPLGETLSGQAAKNKKLLNVKELPDGYITILSGMGKSSPRHLVIAPIVYNDNCIGIIELASFKPFGENEELLVCKITEAAANMLNELRTQS